MSWHYLIGILGLALLMVIHEGGHFLVARAYGMRVIKFSIGFGPTFFKVVPEDGYFWFTTAADRIRLRLWRHDPVKHGPTIYQVAMIPFLAYVQIAGMNPLEDIEPDDKGSYANASLPGRIFTIVGGPLANYLFASVLFFLCFNWSGRSVLTTDVTVIDNNPAAAAGLKSGDRILEIAGTPVKDWNEMRGAIAHHPGDPVPVTVDRAGERLTFTVTPARSENGEGKIGVSNPGQPTRVKVSTKEALTLAVTMPPEVVQSMLVSIARLFVGKGEGQLSGPVGIIKQTAFFAQKGWPDLLEFLGSLSAYLGAFNLLPFPALDGGRLMFLGYEAATRRRANARIEVHIHAIGFVMMIGLALYVTIFNDGPFGKH
jgi:regulator of sigma E protease